MPDRVFRILYIEDDPALVRLVSKALQRRGHVVESVATAEEGLARLESGGIDLVVLDHHLPAGTGLDFLDRMAGREGAPPVVYVTGSADTAVAVAALRAGAADYVTKTVGEEFIELLGSAVEQTIAKERLRREKARIEREVREARDRAEALLHEVNHRVANSLALASALVGIQANAFADPVVRDALADTQARIAAIGGVHRRLYTSHDVRFVAIDDYLKGLAEELEVAMKAASYLSAVRVLCEPLQIATDKAISIGVIVTELVTNAAKYAYAANAEGEVRVTLRRQDEASVLLEVADDGTGWDGAGPVKGTGVGTRVIRAMASGLGSQVMFTVDGGTRAALVIPLEPYQPAAP